MTNTRDTVNYFLQRIGNASHIKTRYEGGECKIFADGKEVAVITDDLLYVPVCPASAPLAKLCDTDVPYLGAPQHYVISEQEIANIHILGKVLLQIARS